MVHLLHFLKKRDSYLYKIIEGQDQSNVTHCRNPGYSATPGYRVVRHVWRHLDNILIPKMPAARVKMKVTKNVLNNISNVKGSFKASTL